MISVEEKEQLINNIFEETKSIAKKGMVDAEYDSVGEIMKAMYPLLKEYNKGIMEIINPMSELTLPLLVYVFKNILAELERQLDETNIGAKYMLKLIEANYSSVSYNVPKN